MNPSIKAKIFARETDHDTGYKASNDALELWLLEDCLKVECKRRQHSAQWASVLVSASPHWRYRNALLLSQGCSRMLMMPETAQRHRSPLKETESGSFIQPLMREGESQQVAMHMVGKPSMVGRAWKKRLRIEQRLRTAI